ncbi:pantoate--beta-alanine ligase [Deinococcus maricopensis]|uniref:Pantothenate synthetase n=1 Tax=Deinococcus maricopensis (strain DSM 21211 / LMG 22137 / NRRL B-23946 / LB-34) TaxID=709986 RepID=E8UB03_DEIML|nr:pantoate--beta-alanine ligase [Deinococcus maricopensis]ADV68242.1 Pantothenate synthetase [Deinococcus maricopensis DSM 21211]
MIKVTTVAALREALAGARRVGFVPTMGYLHEGHATLVRRARAESDRVVVSVFVNPRQFGANEDLSRYPRDLERDTQVAAEAGADVLFVPDVGEVYPHGYVTNVQVGGVSAGFEGASRPGHFDGVATVVLKLLNMVQPARAYFGEKDWQQLAVVRRMVRDLNVPVEIVGVPTVRAASGLALSSRNSYFTDEGRAQATALSAALRAVQAAYASGTRDGDALREVGAAALAREAAFTLDYLDVVDPDLQPVGAVTEEVAVGARIVAAARIHGVRLIDNLPLVPQD